MLIVDHSRNLIANFDLPYLAFIHGYISHVKLSHSRININSTDLIS